METMQIADLENDKGICCIDPHGDMCEHLLHHIPEHRISQVIYFNPGEYSIPFNPLADIPPAQHHLAASGLISAFRQIWAHSWGVRMEHILRFCLLTILEHGGCLLDIPPLLTNQAYRSKILARIHSNHILAFWFNEFDKYSPAFRNEAIAPILNKFSLFQASTPLRNTVGHTRSSFQIKDILDNGYVLLCNLSKAKLGEDTTSLLGSMLVNSIQLAALARVDQEIEERRPFYLYVDECHCFMSEAFIGILSECRKYGLGLTLAHQYIEQLDEKISAAVFGNVGTLICFRVGAADSEYLENEFYPVFNKSDLVNLERYSIRLKMQIDGATSKPFSATTTKIAKMKQYSKGIINEEMRRLSQIKSVKMSIAHLQNGDKREESQSLFRELE